jgi:hypothetical protein
MLVALLVCKGRVGRAQLSSRFLTNWLGQTPAAAGRRKGKYGNGLDDRRRCRRGP